MTDMTRFQAILRQRCPQCLEGRAFAGMVNMHTHCPQCGHRFEREPGYFLGAMYISYPISVIFMLLFWWMVALIFPDLTMYQSLFLGVLMYVPLIPPTFRYSRVLWMHFDPKHVDDP